MYACYGACMADAMVTVQVRLGVDEHAALVRYAAKQDASVNATVRALLRVGLEHCGEKLEPIPEVDRGSR